MIKAVRAFEIQVHQRNRDVISYCQEQIHRPFRRRDRYYTSPLFSECIFRLGSKRGIVIN